MKSMARSEILDAIATQRRTMREAQRRNGFTGVVVARTLDVTVYWPLFIAARLGWMRNRSRIKRRRFPEGSGGDDGGMDTGGVRAPLPTTPPTLSGSNARAFPPTD